MAENTKIEWADHTFNPWIGCQKVSWACDHCYAETLMDTRLGQVEWGPGKPRKRTSETNWRLPYKWNRQAEEAGKPARVFCASLADVFDNAVPESWRVDLWQVIDDTPHLVWMLLTKRPQNIGQMLPADDLRDRIWLGTTTENETELDRRAPSLLAQRAALHFLSCEPLLGPLDNLRPFILPYGSGRPRIGWVIVGGESGASARPMQAGWAYAIAGQCQEAGVPFFFKQHGEWLHQSQMDATGRYWETGGKDFVRVGKKRAGRMLDGREWNGMPP